MKSAVGAVFCKKGSQCFSYIVRCFQNKGLNDRGIGNGWAGFGHRTVFQKSIHPSSRHCNLFATQVNDSVEGHARQL